MKQKIDYNYGIETFDKKRIARWCRWYDRRSHQRCYSKKKKTGKSFRECLNESVKETFTEDLPGTSHVYQMGKKDGRKQGTTEQAKRDEIKIQKIREDHERDRQKWEQIDKEKDELIDEMEKNL